MTLLPCKMTAMDRLEDAEERVANAHRKVDRLESSPQAPTDPDVLARARAELKGAQRLWNAARIEAARFRA